MSQRITLQINLKRECTYFQGEMNFPESTNYLEKQKKPLPGCLFLLKTCNEIFTVG